METNIFLDIFGKQTTQDESGNMEFHTQGRRYDEGEARCIAYEESALSGMEGATTTVKVENDIVSLIRSGSVQSNMVFARGQRCVHQYATPEGMLELGVFPLRMDVDLGDRQGHLKMEYQLDINGCFTSTNSLEITYRAVP
jgi:uncharacterized beta-barrel protein YwiB (DUF1934 family)